MGSGRSSRVTEENYPGIEFEVTFGYFRSVRKTLFNET